MSLQDEAVERVRRVPWLRNCGESVELKIEGWALTQADGVSQVERSQAIWRDIVEGATGDLQGFLFREARDEHRRWNDRVRASNEVLGGSVMPAISARLNELGLGDAEAVVRWQVRSCLIELSLPLPGAPVFFEKVLQVFEAGHLPCGWSGTFPSSTSPPGGWAANYISSGTVVYY